MLRNAGLFYTFLYIYWEKKPLETELIKPANPNTLKPGNTTFTERWKFMCIQAVHKIRRKPCGEMACEHAVRYLNSGAQHRCYCCVTNYKSCIF